MGLTLVHASCLQLAQANLLLRVCCMSYDRSIKTWLHVYFILILQARQQSRTVPLALCAMFHGSFPLLVGCGRPPRKPCWRAAAGGRADVSLTNVTNHAVRGGAWGVGAPARETCSAVACQNHGQPPCFFSDLRRIRTCFKTVSTLFTPPLQNLAAGEAD